MRERVSFVCFYSVQINYDDYMRECVKDEGNLLRDENPLSLMKW